MRIPKELAKTIYMTTDDANELSIHGEVTAYEVTTDAQSLADHVVQHVDGNETDSIAIAVYQLVAVRKYTVNIVAEFDDEVASEVAPEKTRKGR